MRMKSQAGPKGLQNEEIQYDKPNKRFKRVFNIRERDYTSIDIYIIDINCKHHLALQ